MDDVYEFLAKGIRKNVNKQFGDKNENLKLVQELLLMDDGTEEYKERIDKCLEKIRLQNLKFQEEISNIFTATLDENGEIVELKDTSK